MALINKLLGIILSIPLIPRTISIIQQRKRHKKIKDQFHTNQISNTELNEFQLKISLDSNIINIEYLIGIGWKITINDPLPSFATVTNKNGLLQYTQRDDKLILTHKMHTMIVNKDPFSISIDNFELSFEFGKRWTRHDINVSANHIYGMGEKSHQIDKKNQKYIFYNSDNAAFEINSDPLYKSIPFAIYTDEINSWGLFVDFPGYIDWENNANDAIIHSKITALSKNYRIFLIPENSMKNILRAYSKLTGYAPIPPLWALGYHQCRWSYYSQDEVENIVNKFHELKIPIDAIYLDIDYLDNYKSFTWDKNSFPDLKGLTSKLNNVHVVSMIDPGIKVEPGYKIYDDIIKNEYYTRLDNKPFIGNVWPGACVFPDFINSEVREWWGDNYKSLIDIGISGFWNDMNEPSIFSLLSTIPPNASHRLNDIDIQHECVHNAYGLMMIRASYEGINRLSKNRVFLLSRSGYAGLQKYAWVWTGDNKSNWDHLAMSIPKCINLGMSGVPGVGADIGGFRGSPSPELYARWIELGTFYPLMRTHTIEKSPPQEPWSFGSMVTEISKKYIRLRYKLIPYTYTWMVYACKTGIPLMRPLFLEFNEKESYKWANSIFMFGPSLLIAPVINKGERSRELYLPKGDWYSFDKKEKIKGGRTINVSAELDTIPIFVKNNTIIPICNNNPMNTTECDLSAIDYLVYGDTAKGILYLDDGMSKNPSYKLLELNLKGGTVITKEISFSQI